MHLSGDYKQSVHVDYIVAVCYHMGTQSVSHELEFPLTCHVWRFYEIQASSRDSC